MKKVLVPFAENSEDMEMIILTDILCRAGINVVRGASTKGIISLQYGTRIVCDLTFIEMSKSNFDLIAIPGGWKGVERLLNDTHFVEVLKNHYSRNYPIAAVCSAPNLLRKLGMIQNQIQFTAHPDSLSLSEGGIGLVDKSVVVDNQFITGRSAGFTKDWALQIVEFLFDSSKRLEIESAIM